LARIYSEAESGGCFLLRRGYLAAGREVNHSAHAATDGTSCAFSTGVLLAGSVEAKI